MGELLNKFKSKRAATAERPGSLVADSLARYSFVAKFCVGKKVLDVGTGFGFGAEYIAKNRAKEVLGVDYNKEAIEAATKRKSLKNLSFKVVNAFDLAKIGQKFDVILAFEVIEHLPVDRVGEFLAHIYNSLLPKGRLFLSTPNAAKSTFLWGKPYNPYHTKEYQESELEELLLAFFPRVKIRGYRLKNKKYKKRQSEISSLPISKIFFYLGHFKIIREILALFPKELKNFFNKEHTLPPLDRDDYEFKDFTRDCEGLMAEARKSVEKIKTFPKVSVIIANYNGERYLKKCLDSVFALSYPKFEVIVCDDGSKDLSLEILKSYQKKAGNFRILRNKKNLGASATRNRAAKFAKGEVLVFLDNDTQVRRDWLLKIVEPFIAKPNIGGVQSLLLDMDKKALIQHAGAIMLPQVAWAVPFYQWKSYTKTKRLLKERQIIAVSAALAVRKKVFEKIGGFDEKEAVYTEDTDFSWRVWIAGYEVVLAKDAIVYHLAKSVTARAHMGGSYYKIYFHLAKNSFRSIIKNYQLKNVLKYLPQSVLVNIGRGFLVLIRRGEQSALLASIRAIFWNFGNLSDNLRQRHLVQSKRLFSDKFIMEKVFDQRSLNEIYQSYFVQTGLI